MWSVWYGDGMRVLSVLVAALCFVVGPATAQSSTPPGPAATALMEYAYAGKLKLVKRLVSEGTPVTWLLFSATTL